MDSDGCAVVLCFVAQLFPLPHSRLEDLRDALEKKTTRPDDHVVVTRARLENGKEISGVADLVGRNNSDVRTVFG